MQSFLPGACYIIQEHLFSFDRTLSHSRIASSRYTLLLFIYFFLNNTFYLSNFILLQRFTRLKEYSLIMHRAK